LPPPTFFKELDMIEYKNILFCTDFSEDAGIAFIHALDLSRKHRARLHILHIPHSSYTYLRHVVDEHVPADAPGGESFFGKKVEEAALEALKREYGGKLKGFDDFLFIVRSGSPDVEIVRYAKKNAVDVIVMGALGKAEQDRLIHGSTVTNVSRFAHCHVIAIRNPAKKFTLPGGI
jgi:nucleotide-binding universal stress UspA family protein